MASRTMRQKLELDVEQFIGATNRARKATEMLAGSTEKYSGVYVKLANGARTLTSVQRGVDKAGNEVIQTWEKSGKSAKKFGDAVSQLVREEIRFIDVEHQAKEQKLARWKETGKASEERLKQGKAAHAEGIKQGNKMRAWHQKNQAKIKKIHADAAKARTAAEISGRKARRKGEMEWVKFQQHLLEGRVKGADKEQKANLKRQSKALKARRAVLANDLKLIEKEEARPGRQQRHERMAAGFRKVGTAAHSLALKAKSVTTGFDKMGNKTVVSLKRTATAVKKNVKAVGMLEIGWKSFFRLIALRAAAGLIFRIRAELKALADEFATFNKSIGEVQTIIAPEEKGAAFSSKISDAVVQVAIDNNIKLTDSVNAFYANLSNQVSNNLSGLTQFTLTSVRLSKATVSTLEDSGNAISSIIQAYNLSFLDAERVSASLFKTVDEGRLRLTEVANTMGTIGVPAHALGITFEETNAALARLTLQGIKVNRAQTLMRNVFLKLLKPTEKLKELYKEWGVNSGEAAISAFGLSGVLQRLFEESKKGANVLPELFGRIRASIGAQGLAGTQENVEKFIATLDKVSNATDEFNTGVKIIQETLGEKFQKVLNETRILFTTIFGAAVVKLVVTFNEHLIESSGETQNLARWFLQMAVAATAATGAILLAISALAAIALAAEVAAAVSISLGAAMAIISLPLVAITALAVAVGFIAFKAAGASMEVQRLNAELSKLSAEKVASFTTQITEETVANSKRYTAEFREQAEQAAAVTRALTGQLDSIARIVEGHQKTRENYVALAKLITTSKRDYITIEGIQYRTNSSLKARLDILKEELTTQKAILKTAQQRQADLPFQFEGARFERSQRGKSDMDQINAQANRSRNLSARAQSAFNAGDFEAGRKFMDEAVRLMTQADQQNFDLFGTSNFEQDFANLENLALNLEKQAEKRAQQKIRQAEEEIEHKKAWIEYNLEQLRVEQVKLDELKETRTNIAEILDNDNLTMERRIELVMANLKILEVTEGSQSLVLTLLYEQFNIEQRIQQLKQEGLEREQRKLHLTQLAQDRDAALVARQQLREDSILKFETDLNEQSKQAFIDNAKAIAMLPFGGGWQNVWDTSDMVAGFTEAKEEFLRLQKVFDDAQTPEGRAAAFKDLSTFGQGTDVNEGKNFENQEKITEWSEKIIELKKQHKIVTDEQAVSMEKLRTAQAAGQTAEILNAESEIKEKRAELDEINAILDKRLVTQATLEGEGAETAEATNLRVDAKRNLAQATERVATAERDSADAYVESFQVGVQLAEAEAAHEEGAERRQQNQDLMTQSKVEEAIQEGVLTNMIDGKRISNENLKEAVDKVSTAEKAVANEAIPVVQSSMEGLKTKQNQLKTNTDLLTESYVGLAKAMTGAFGDSVNPNPGGYRGVPTAPGHAQGGSIFRRVGSDTVPAMLTPGEFVVNARSAQAHIGLLNRINSGRGPQYFDRGGTVNTDNSTNTINLQSTSNESLDARRIQRALNKGKRRGTSSSRPRNFA